MKYSYVFQVRAPLHAVREFHLRPGGVAALTPPPAFVQVQRAPERIQEGEEMDFTLWLGPLPVRWQACFQDVSENGFTDRQARGPFRCWIHRHRFILLEEDKTEIRDEIEVRLRRHPFWGPFGLLMRLSLPALFAFRRWKTRRILEER